MTETTKSSNVLLQIDIPELALYASGKVRDIYRVNANHLLFVASDRISAFDYVLATGIPEKGRVLTQLSLFWFEFLKDIVPNHLATADIAQYPPELQKYSGFSVSRINRSMLRPLPCRKSCLSFVRIFMHVLSGTRILMALCVLKL